MQTKEQFIERILTGARASEVAKQASTPLAIFRKLPGLPVVAATTTARPFAQALLEEAGFGAGQTIPREEVVLGEQKTNRFLPAGATYWPKTVERPFHIILFEIQPKAREVIADAFFRQTDQLEDAMHRIIQDALEGFERGGAGRTADRRQGAQHETLCVVSVTDNRREGAERQIVCFGTRCVATDALEVFTLREEARDWAERGDRPLAEEHLGQLFERHFKPLSRGAKWQEAFVSGPERKKAAALVAACRQSRLTDQAEDTLRDTVRDLLDEIAWSFGIPRRKANDKRCLEMVDLPASHGIAFDPDESRRSGFVNPLRGVRVYDSSERLLGFIVYFPSDRADLDRLRAQLRAHNHFHNVLVIYPDQEAPELELWQGPEPLRGRLVSGSRRSQFDGEGGVVQLLSRFFVVSKSAIEKPAQLAGELAWRARHLKALAIEELAKESARGSGPLKTLYDVFNQALATLTPEQFADAYAQTITYGMLAARWLSTDRDKLLFARRNLAELLPSTSPFLHDIFQQLVNSDFDKNLSWLLDDVTSLLARTSVAQVFYGERDPSIHFYQDFLDAYDPQIRRDQGVYYTPDEVVEFMVRSVDQVLRERLGLRLGLADASTWGQWAKQQARPVPAATDPEEYVVQMLDPATGTGTFLLHIVEIIFETMTAEYERLGYDDERAASEWKAYVRKHLLPRLNAFELMMAPYIVSHLRIGLALERGLAEQSGRDVSRWGFHFTRGDRLRVFLTNTLELGASPQLNLLGEHVAEEAREAERLKRTAAISVLIGNPPYDRVARNTGGEGQSWVLSGRVPGRASDKSLFDDVLDVAREHTIFSHHASLYNLYVYFWRWAFWKAFERDPEAPGVVSFITASSWLTGPGFVGLRQMARQHGDEIWSLDLGGDNKGANPEPNIFNIETPVACSLVGRFEVDRTATTATACYRKISGGSAAEKLAAVRDLCQVGGALSGNWVEAAALSRSSLVPATGSVDWLQMPALADMFPWQQPGCMHSRSWPISPSPETLAARWRKFVSSSAAERPDLYVTPTSGRSIFTRVAGYDRLADLDKTAENEAVVRFGYRSFDRQWTFDDPRLAKTESPSLWRSQSTRQVFLTSMMTAEMSAGPCVTATAYVPDKHYFCGRGGKDVIPLYRDDEGLRPNITGGILSLLAARIDIAEPLAEDLAAYVFALLSSHRYQQRFARALQTPGPRVPVTADPACWNEAVELGSRLIWLHTYAERFIDDVKRPPNRLPDIPGLRWAAPVLAMPEKPSETGYDEASQTLFVGDGRIVGVQPEVWAFEVSGMPVVKKWLGYRTIKGAGKAASSTNPLDKIRPTTWPAAWNGELLDLLRVLTLTLEMQPKLAVLLDRICDGPLIPAADLPTPAPAEREEPRSERRSSRGLFSDHE